MLTSFEPILSTMQLRELEKHKYSCHSSSFVEPFLQPAWNWLVTKLPLWLAPNLITITGLAINIATSLLLVYYSPDGKSEVPRWSSLACAIGLFVYQTLDAIDGKQARRTGSMSPLGELFDHGCDSLSIVFVSLAACISAGLGSHSWWMFVQCFAAFTLFYCAHWQAYVSGMMKFGKFDVTEAQFGIILIHLITSLFGFQIWNTEGTSVLSPAIPLVLVLLPGYVIAWNSEQNIFKDHPALYIITFGLVAAKVTNKLVIAHMCKSELECFDRILTVPALLLANQYFGYLLNEYYVLWFCLMWAAWDLFVYCTVVCLEICNFSGIQLFRIKPPVVQEHKMPTNSVPNKKAL